MSRRNFQNGKSDECWKNLKNDENFDPFQFWERLKTFWWCLSLSSRYLELSPGHEWFIETNHKAIRRIEMNLKVYRWPQHINFLGSKLSFLTCYFGAFWPFLGYPVSSDRPKKFWNGPKMLGKNLEDTWRSYLYVDTNYMVIRDD